MKSFQRKAISTLQINFFYIQTVFKMKEYDWQLLPYFLLWLALLFMVVLSFMDFSWTTCEGFFTIVSFALLQSSCFVFYVHFRSFCATLFTQVPSLNRYEEVTCDNCGTQTTKLNLARHKKGCSAGIICCTHCPIFPQNPKKIEVMTLLRTTVPQNLMLKLDVTFQRKVCFSRDSGILGCTPTWKQLTWLCYQDSKCRSGQNHQRRWWCESERGVALMSTFPCRFWAWTRETQSLELCYREPRCQNSDRKA